MYKSTTLAYIHSCDRKAVKIDDTLLVPVFHLKKDIDSVV